MKWTEEETLKFVELYRDAECLWNLASPTYKNKQMRQTAIENLVKDMGKEGFGVQEAKQKIKNMRSTYNQEVVKIKKSTKSGAGTQDIYTPSVKWFTVLDPIMKIGRGSSEVTSNLESQTVDAEVEVGDHLEDDGDESETIITATCGQETPRRVATSDTTSSVQTHNGSKPTGRKRRIQELSHAVKHLRAVSEKLAQPINHQEDDEIDVFGTYVSKSLKKLSADDAICAQQEIQGILTKYRLGNRGPVGVQTNQYNPSDSVPNSPHSSNFYVPQPSGLLSLADIVAETVTLQ